MKDYELLIYGILIFCFFAAFVGLAKIYLEINWKDSKFHEWWDKK